MTYCKTFTLPRFSVIQIIVSHFYVSQIDSVAVIQDIVLRLTSFKLMSQTPSKLT